MHQSKGKKRPVKEMNLKGKGVINVWNENECLYIRFVQVATEIQMYRWLKDSESESPKQSF